MSRAAKAIYLVVAVLGEIVAVLAATLWQSNLSMPLFTSGVGIAIGAMLVLFCHPLRGMDVYMFAFTWMGLSGLLFNGLNIFPPSASLGWYILNWTLPAFASVYLIPAACWLSGPIMDVFVEAFVPNISATFDD